MKNVSRAKSLDLIFMVSLGYFTDLGWQNKENKDSSFCTTVPDGKTIPLSVLTDKQITHGVLFALYVIGVVETKQQIQTVYCWFKTFSYCLTDRISKQNYHTIESAIVYALVHIYIAI